MLLAALGAMLALTGCDRGSELSASELPSWTAAECSPVVAAARSKAADVQAAALADVRSESRDAKQWSGAVRAATISGDRSPDALRPTPDADAPFEVRLAVLSQDCEALSRDPAAVDRLGRLADEAPAGLLRAYAESAAACAGARTSLRSGAADSALLETLSASADALNEIRGVPEARISEAAARAELAALDQARRAGHLASARGALKRLQEPGLRLERVVRPGELFGISPIDSETAVIVASRDSLGDCADAVDAVLKRAMPVGTAPVRLRDGAGDGDALREAVKDAVAVRKPRRIVAVVGALATRDDDRDARLLGDRLGRDGIQLHLVVVQPDPIGPAPVRGTAVELARRSRGTLRRVSSTDLAAAAGMTEEECARLWGQWSPMLDRQRALVEVSLGLLEGGAGEIVVPPAALARLVPDPVLADTEPGGSHDWRALMLSAAAKARTDAAAAGDDLLLAAQVASEAANGDDVPPGSVAADALHEIAARALLLRALLPGRATVDERLLEVRSRLRELGIPGGSWSAALVDASSGALAKFRAGRSASVSGAEGARRAWELEAAVYLLGGGDPPASRTVPAGIPFWEAAILSVALEAKQQAAHSP